MASNPTEEKRDRVSKDPLRSPIIQHDGVPASEVGRTPVVGLPAPGALAFEREREMRSSMDRIDLVDGSPSTSALVDLSYSQVIATPKLAPLSNAIEYNLPTRKGGPESPCTRNGCADSILMVSRDHVECSASAYNGIEHSTALSSEAQSPNATTVISNTNKAGINPEMVDTQSPNAATDYSNANNSDSNIIVNSNVNANSPDASDTYATWCHTGGLLRSTTSVGPSTTYPLTHGANATNGVVVTPRNDSAPVIREPLINHTLPQHNNYPVIREPLMHHTLPQHNDHPVIREPFTNKPLPQPNITLPQSMVDTESTPVFYMFVQADGQQPTSSFRVKEEAAEESHQLATDDNSKVSRPPLYTQWNPDTGMTEVRRGYRSPIPEGEYISRTWTHAPPEPHIIRYEGVKHGYRGLVTRIHNPKTGYFEVKRSPPPSPTVSPVPGLHGTSRDI